MSATISRNSHPLLGRSVTTSSSFFEWKEEWDQATSKAHMLGLLHELYKPCFALDEDAVMFLIDIADGYAQSESFTSPESTLGEAQGRLELSKKAFAVLCGCFFTKATKGLRTLQSPCSRLDAGDSSWLFNAEMRAKVFWFFRLDPCWRTEMANLRFSTLKSGPQDGGPPAAILEFLDRLAAVAWGTSFEDRDLVAELRSRLVGILHAQGKLYEKLLDAKPDPLVRDALRELALTDMGKRFNSVLEAFLAGSQPATVLYVWSQKSREIQL